MEIEVGKYYENKTWRFLMPVLRGHGELFAQKFNSLFKFAVGIHDTLLDGTPLLKGRNILVMLDKEYQPKIYQSFVDWIQYQPYYKGDYCPDADFKTSRKHVFILEVPEAFNNAYDMFLKSEYSKMYSEEEINILFSNKGRIREKEILTKSTLAYNKFLEKNNNLFNLNIEPSKFKPEEYEFPLVICEEVFNCKEGERVFFNEELDKTWN